MKSLFRRYLGALSVLVSASVLLIGTLLSVHHYSEDSRRAQQIQAVEALAASASIREYLSGIEHVLASLGARVDVGAILSREAQANDFREALKFEPAILNIRSTDRAFRETQFVSRVVPDRLESGLSVPWMQQILSGCQSEFCFGSAFIRDQTEPYIQLVARPLPGDREILAAEISLRFISDVLLQLSPKPSARAYVLDAHDRMLAHPDLRILLQNSDMSAFEQVRKVRAAIREHRQSLPSVWARGPGGADVFTGGNEIAGSQWLVFVEEPADEVLSAVRQTIGATLLLLAIGLAAAYAASLFLARHLARPITALKDGAARFGAGDLSASIDVRTGDEIESVAIAFNQMAASLQALYGSLEAKVQARTEELAQANARVSAQARQLTTLNTQLAEQVVELDVKRAAADRANAAKTRFVAAASHDLRQPMHAVGLLVGILAARQTSPEIAALLNKIQLSVTALEELFGALLDISRLDAGIVKPNPTCVSLANLLRSVDLAHAREAEDKGLHLRVVESRTLVISDGALLLSILTNLVSNAIRYTQHGHVDVFCRKGGRHVDVLIADSGVGIPEDQLEAIFEEFYQIATTARHHGPGLGLGLAIARRTSELLGHQLIARSVAGAGSVFGVRLPLADLRSIQQPLPRVTPEPDARLAGAFVVLIDDDEKSRFATESLFTSWQCHVISGDNAATVRNALAQHLRQPDLIVADYWLRDGMTGTAVIQQLRLDAEATVPAIILTADQNMGFAGGNTSQSVMLLRKPATAQQIRRAAIELLRQSAGADSQVSSPA